MDKILCVRLGYVSAVSLLVGVGMVSQAHAGSFSVREQSAYFQGSAFAGAAAGGDVSSIFWNPAASSTLSGFNTSLNGTVIFGDSELTANNGALLLSPNSRTTNIGTDSLVPAMYGTYQISDRLSAGLAVNAPFGFTTKPDNAWVGSTLATTSKITSLDFTPTLAYKLTPEISFGVGAQVMYFKATLDGLARDIEADSWGAGFVIGALWQPSPFTSIGVGYRSNIDQSLEGRYIPSGNLVEAGADMMLPGQVTLSGRQVLTDRFTALATVSWQEASVINNVNVLSSYCPGGLCETIHFNYNDQWYFSLGGEYAYSPSLTLRAGVSYEISPITDSTRDITIPDSNRVGISVGGSYKWSDRVTFDLAYTHLFFDDAPFCIATPDGVHVDHCAAGRPVLLAGTADTAADLLSVGAKYSTSAPVVPLETYKK